MAASSLISSNEAGDVELGRKQAKQHAGPSARRILSLASQESRYITVGIVTLLVRLPLSLAMPHYMSATVGRAIASTSQDGPFLPAGVWDNFKRFLLSACGNAALGACNHCFGKAWLHVRDGLWSSFCSRRRQTGRTGAPFPIDENRG